jgi:PPK2 family polyphosphate:nucleotide phosphotransferase
MDTGQRQRIQKMIEPMLVKPGKKVRLPDDFDPGYSAPGLDKEDGPALLREGVEHLSELQDKLYSQDTYGVLLVLQALDAAGKDGMIKHVMSGINPQGVHVTSFKSPSEEDLDHTYLWRIQRSVPARGMIGIFNRSHYEDVLVVRVHPEYLEHAQLPPGAVDDGIWKRRYREINDFERHLDDNGIRVVKIFLNVSKQEQRQRFLDRIEDPTKNWKFSGGDLEEREHWDAYQKAFSEMLSATSTEHAPWYVVPADKKWFARLAGAAILTHTLLQIDPHYPELAEEEQARLGEHRARLLAESPGA